MISLILSYLDIFFLQTPLTTLFLGSPQLCLNVRMMKMCCNEPLVSLNVFQAKPTQFTNQVIFFFLFNFFPTLPALQMQPGISSPILRAQVSSPNNKNLVPEIFPRVMMLMCQTEQKPALFPTTILSLNCQQ